MDEPVTRLDERFSDPGARPTTWSATRDALEAAQLAWISTVRADGRPHVSPLVAVWLDGAIHFSTGAREQKAVNLASNPQVVVMTGCNTWDQGLDIMVEGEARRVTDRGTLERLATAWRSKWDGSWQFDVTDDGFHQESGGDALVFAVEPTKVLAFGRQRPSDLEPQAGQDAQDDPSVATMLPRVAFTHTRHLPARRRRHP